jgi:hypothetical protein
MSTKNNYEIQLNRANISVKDFEEALEYLKPYQKYQFNIINKALLVAGIISYSRPFTKNKGDIDKATSFLSVNLKRIYTSRELLLHDKILSYRNEAIAHSDFKRRPTRLVKSDSNGFITMSKAFDIQSELIDTEMFIGICEKMKKYCTDKMFELNRKISLL